MRPVRWSQSPADDTVVEPKEPEEQAVPAPPEWAPTESPGVFVAQPLERWSPRDVVVGAARLVRWTGAAIGRGVVTS